MKNIIIIENEEETLAYTCLTTICEDFKQFSYHYIKKQKYPFRYKGFNFKKLTVKR
jgi:hypothetical protein